METIGLIAAMIQERDALLHQASEWKKRSIGNLIGHFNEISGYDYFLITSGMGVNRAATAARKLIEITSARYIISFGIAGAVQASLEIGDVVLIEGVCELEGGSPGPWIPLRPWSQPAFDAAKRLLAKRGARLYTGTAITTGGSQVTDAQLSGISVPVLEMETMGIAQVAAEKNIPFLAVRAISDGPSAPVPFDLGEMMDENANLRIGKLLMMIARHPGIINDLNKMRRNASIAVDNAAVALMAMLNHPFVDAG